MHEYFLEHPSGGSVHVPALLTSCFGFGSFARYHVGRRLLAWRASCARGKSLADVSRSKSKRWIPVGNEQKRVSEYPVVPSEHALNETEQTAGIMAGEQDCEHATTTTTSVAMNRRSSAR
jgi:hypothetical protein